MEGHEEKGSPGEQIISFELAKEVFGLNIGNVERIAYLESITHVPRAPSFIVGIMNMAGRIITLVDLSKILELEGRGNFEQVIILEKETINIGLLTGFVTDVITIDEKSKTDSVIMLDAKDKGFISSVINTGDKIINLLDVDKLVDFIGNSFSEL